MAGDLNWPSTIPSGNVPKPTPNARMSTAPKRTRANTPPNKAVNLMMANSTNGRGGASGSKKELTTRAKSQRLAAPRLAPIATLKPANQPTHANPAALAAKPSNPTAHNTGAMPVFELRLPTASAEWVLVVMVAFAGFAFFALYFFGVSVERVGRAHDGADTSGEAQGQPD